MSWKIVQHGSEYCVENYADDGSREKVENGCHSTYAEATDHLRTLYASADTETKKSISGAMLAFYPEPEITQRLYQATVAAQITPQPIGDMHMMLVYLGETLDEAQINALVIKLRTFADQQQDLNGVINGVGRFRNTNLNAVYANVDSGGLPTFRQQLCELVQQCGIDYPLDHGFTPHITLAYVPNDLPIKEIVFEPIVTHFTSVVLAVDGNQTAFQLAGYPRESLMEKATERSTDPVLDVPDKNEHLTHEAVKNDPAIAVPDASTLHGPFPGNDQQFGILSSPGVRREVQSALNKLRRKKDDLVQIASNKGYISPAPMGLIDNRKTGLTVVKGLDGLRYMFIVTSNSYKDREQETITTKALNRYVDQSWLTNDKCRPDNTLLFWHDGQPIGDIVWCDTEGPFLLEIAKERADATIQLKSKGKPRTARIKAIWDAIEQSAHKIHWAASHGFEYPPQAKDKQHTYHAIRKFETSVLPLKNAANPYTFSGVINMNERDKFLNKLLGIPDAAENVLSFRKGIRSVERDLKDRGIQHKATKGILENLTSTIHDLLSKITDNPSPELEEEMLQAIVQSIASSDPAGSGEMDMDETYDAMPPEADDEMKEEDTTNEYLSDDKVPANHNVKPNEAAQMGGKAMTRFVDQMVSVQSAQANQMERLTKALESLAPIADVPTQMNSIADRLATVEKKLAARPRQASTSPETIEINKELEQKVMEQNAKVDTFWQARVKGE